jgi:hypothetical protein
VFSEDSSKKPLNKERSVDQESPKKLNLDLVKSPPVEEADEDPEYMYKLHQGLVKIQSLIRGVLARVRFKRLFEQK